MNYRLRGKDCVRSITLATRRSALGAQYHTEVIDFRAADDNAAAPIRRGYAKQTIVRIVVRAAERIERVARSRSLRPRYPPTAQDRQIGRLHYPRPSLAPLRANQRN